MRVILDKAGKKFSSDWIFRNVSVHFLPEKSYAVLGPNGSGKSTLIQLLAGFTLPSEGNIAYCFPSEEKLHAGDVFRYVSIASPYLELIEELTLKEHLTFHFRFKKSIANKTPEEIVGISGLGDAQHKQIRFFSSGMKQRLRLTLAFLSETPMLLLDEPLSNLDKKGVLWYQSMVETYGLGRLTIVSSNHNEAEYGFCTETLDMLHFKDI